MISKDILAIYIFNQETYQIEFTTKKVESRDPEAVELPPGALLFYFYDYVEHIEGGDTLRGEIINRSEVFYPPNLH